jgi:translocator protein
MAIKQASQLVFCVIACELVGILSTPFTIAAIPSWYVFLEKPFFSPPNWLFGPVWTLLYFLMGVSIYLIWKQGLQKAKVKQAVILFVIQLALNFAWSFLFFGLRSPVLGLIDILVLLVFIVATMKNFYHLSKTAFYLLVPYLLWVSFATLLNASIATLN